MREIMALAAKDIRLLVRDKVGFLFTFFFPLLMAIFFGTIFSGDDDSSAISILVVDEDQTEQSQKFIAALDGSAELDLELSTREDAIERVRLGQKVAYIVVKEGFGTAMERVFWADPPAIELGVDPARRAEAGMLTGILTKYAAEGLKEVFNNRTTMRKQIQEALGAIRMPRSKSEERRSSLTQFLTELDSFVDTKESSSGNFRGFEPILIEKVEIIRERKGPPNAFSISFPQGVMWGIIGCAAAFSVSLVSERTRGTLVRLRTAPIAHLQILAGKALACFITTVSVPVLLFTIARVVFSVRAASISLLGLSIFVTSLCFVGIMMFLSVLGKTEQAASGIGWGIMLVMAMLGGGMIPLFIMPAWMQDISHISPVKWGILAFEGAIWRNFTIREMLLPWAILLSVGAVFFTIGVKAFRWTAQD